MKQRWFVLALALCIGFSITPPVLLMFGLAQFKIRSLVGADQLLTTFGYSSALVSIVMIGFSPVSGALADRLYRWWGNWQGCLLAASMLGGVALLGLGASQGLAVLLLCWILVLGGYGLVGAACTALIAARVKLAVRGRSYGAVGIAIPLCAMGCSVLIFGVLATSSLLVKLVVLAALQWLVCLVTCRVLRTHVPALDKAAPAATYAIPARLLFRRYPAFCWMFCCKLCVNTAIASLKMMPLFYIARLQLSEAAVYQLNALTAVGTLFLIVTSLATGIVVDRRDIVRLLQGGSCVLIALAMAGYIWADQTWHIVMLSCLTSVALGMGGATGNLLVNRVLPDPGSYVRDISIIQSSAHIGAVLIGLGGPWLVTWSRTTFGGDGFEGFFLLQAVLALLGGCCVWRIRGASYHRG